MGILGGSFVFLLYIQSRTTMSSDSYLEARNSKAAALRLNAMEKTKKLATLKQFLFFPSTPQDNDLRISKLLR